MNKIEQWETKVAVNKIFNDDHIFYCKKSRLNNEAFDFSEKADVIPTKLA